MSDDTYEESTTKSFGDRLGGSFKGLIFGVLLILIASIMFFWTERNSVKTYNTLKEGESIVLSIDSKNVNPANEGKLVHLTGKTQIKKGITDKLFGISVNALILDRTASMYQWKEKSVNKTVKNYDGSETTKTKYSYSKVWSESIINSNNFKKHDIYRNPTSMKIRSREMINDTISLGAFHIPVSLAKQISFGEELKIDNINNISSTISSKSSLSDNTIYISNGGTPQDPKIGDIKVYYMVKYPQNVSILAVQKGNAFGVYNAKAGGELYVLGQGKLSSKEMFNLEHRVNTVLTWTLRCVGILLMFFGFKMLFGVLSVLFGAVPILGNIMEFGITLISFIVALSISLIIIAIAWLLYRPMVSLVLFTIIAGLLFIIKIRNKKVKKYTMPPIRKK